MASNGNCGDPPMPPSATSPLVYHAEDLGLHPQYLADLLITFTDVDPFTDFGSWENDKSCGKKAAMKKCADTEASTSFPTQPPDQGDVTRINNNIVDPTENIGEATNAAYHDEGISQYNEFFDRINYAKILNNSDDTTIQGTSTHSDTPVGSLNVTTIQGTSTHSDTPVESLNVTTIEEPIHNNDGPEDYEANSYDYLTSITDTLSNDDPDSDVEVIPTPPPSATEGIVLSNDDSDSDVEVISTPPPSATEGIVPSKPLTSINTDTNPDDESADVDVVSIFSPSDNTFGVSFPNTNIVPTPTTQLNTLSTVAKEQQRLPPPSQHKRRFSPASSICDDSFKFSTSGSRTLVRPPRRKAVRAIRSCHRSSTSSQSSVSSTLNNKDDSLDFINELFNINQPTIDFVQNNNIPSPPSTPSPTITKRSNSQETIKDLPEPLSFQELLGTSMDDSQRDIVESHVSTPPNTITPTTTYEPQACQERVELIYDPQKEIEALTLAADTALEYFDSFHKPGLELAESEEHHTLSSNQDGKSTPPNTIDGNIDESILQSSQIETPKQLNTTLKRSDGFTLSDALTLFDAGEISIEDASSNFVGIPVEMLPDDAFNAFFPNTCAVTDKLAQHSRCRPSPPKIRRRATSIELDCEDSMKMSYSGSRTLVRPPRRKVVKQSDAEADAARSVIPSTTLPAVTIPTSATSKRIGLKPSVHTAPEITKGPERKQSISPPASRTPAPKASVTFRDSSKTSQSATSDIKAPMETPHSKDSITSKNNTKIPHPKNPASASGTAGRSRTQDHSSSKKTQTVTKSDIMAVLGAYISHLTPPPLVTPPCEATTQQQRRQQQQQQQPPPANRETQQRSHLKEVLNKIVRDLINMETDEQAELTRSLLKRKVCNEKTNDAKRIKLDHPASPKIENKSKSSGTKSPTIPVTQHNKTTYKSVQKDFSPKQKHSNATQRTEINATKSDRRNVTNETKETKDSFITRTSSTGKQKEKESSKCEVKDKDNNNIFSKEMNINKTPIIPKTKSSTDVEDVKTTKKSPKRGTDSKPRNKNAPQISDNKSKDSSHTSCSQHIHPSKSDKPKSTKSNSITMDTKNPTSEIKRKNTCPDFQPTHIKTNQEKESHKTDNKKREDITKSSPIQRAEKSKTITNQTTPTCDSIPQKHRKTPPSSKRTPDGSSERSAPRPILPTTDWKDGLRPCPHFKQAFKSFKIPKKTKESNNDIATPPNNKSSTLDSSYDL